MKRQLTCRLQNKLGALDRVLAAFTHRGLIPESFSSQVSVCQKELIVSLGFQCPDDHQLEKLVKFLQKQIYVLTVQEPSKAATVSSSSLIAP